MKCAICNQATVKEFTPFCSKACHQEDLLSWIQGRYAIPSSEPAIDSDAITEENDD